MIETSKKPSSTVENKKLKSISSEFDYLRLCHRLPCLNIHCYKIVSHIRTNMDFQTLTLARIAVAKASSII